MTTNTNTTTIDTPPPPTLDGKENRRHAGGINHTDTPRGNAAARFTIAGDKIAAATSTLPDDQREALRWAAGYCRARNITHAELAGMLKKPDGETYSKDSVYHALTGGRTSEQLDNMVAAIQRLRRVEEARGEQVRVGFIETAVSRAIFSTLRKAFLRQKVAMILAESQVGKTTAALEYARTHNHGETKIVRMPTGGALSAFQVELADTLGLPTCLRGADVRRRIFACFDERTLLIVDEAHECLTSNQNGGVRTLNFIREIHDRCKCGVVLIATKVFRHHLLQGTHARNLRQLWLRSMRPTELPDRPGKSDLVAFSAAYGLPPAPDQEIGIRVTALDADGEERTRTITANPLNLQTQIIAEDGLGRWNMILQEASDTAREKRRAMSWGIVLHAWHSFAQLETLADTEESA